MLMKGSYAQRLKTRISGANGHISNDCAANVATVLAHSGLKTLILGHMSEENNCPELAFSTVLSALDANGFSDKVRVELAYQNKCGELIEADENKNFKFSNTGNAFLVAFATFYVLSLIYEFSFRFTSGMSGAAAWCQYLINPVAFIGSMLVYAKRKTSTSCPRRNSTKNRAETNRHTFAVVGMLHYGVLPVSNIFWTYFQGSGSI